MMLARLEYGLPLDITEYQYQYYLSTALVLGL
jgi:hypothetical protein